MWRQTEHEKEKLVQSQMSMDKKSTKKFSKTAVLNKSLLEIPRGMIDLDSDSKDLTLGEGK